MDIDSKSHETPILFSNTAVSKMITSWLTYKWQIPQSLYLFCVLQHHKHKVDQLFTQLMLSSYCLTAWTGLRESSRASDLFSCHCWTGGALWHRTHEVCLTSEWEASLGLSDDFLPPSEPIACRAEAVWRPACTSGAAAHKFAHRRDEKTLQGCFPALRQKSFSTTHYFHTAASLILTEPLNIWRLYGLFGKQRYFAPTHSANLLYISL